MKSILALLILLFSTSLAARPFEIPPPPLVEAKAYMVIDFNSGQVIESRNPDERIEPASLTKLMTSYITFSALRQKLITLNQSIPVSERAWRAEGSRMFIDPKNPVTVDALIHGMIVQSGNDACIALAEGIAGSEEAFAGMMNHEAQRLGMKNTHFVNATGLPNPEHYTTVHDLAILASAIIRDFPEYYPIFSIKEYTWNRITQPNRNRLLWMDPYVDGLKTGHTEEAGYCLVASTKRGPRRLISVLVGAHSDAGRAMESLKILNYALQFYDSVRLYAKGQSVTTLRVWKGKQNTLKAGFAQDLYAAVPKGAASGLKATIEAQQPLIVPVVAGQKVGVVKVSLDGKKFSEYPLIALESVERANIFGRAWDSLTLLFN
ncbi:MAG: D-alanyl-D-alanine carboxypeptidase [Burkholderiales bacterium]|nr:D-alanyl-D-alanine carboxypeptidase [Burkholderiales bacterium]